MSALQGDLLRHGGPQPRVENPACVGRQRQPVAGIVVAVLGVLVGLLFLVLGSQWSGGVVEWWSGGVVEWWRDGVVEGWMDGRRSAKGRD